VSEHTLPHATRVRLHAVGVTARQKAREPGYRKKLKGTWLPWSLWRALEEARLIQSLKERASC
jgi:hypothetical protein